ncbi:MFS transporter [Pseudonocardia endophytica]|uniref:Putative MFS family arabinose efflux permease n=1 Tax=Pseudonocardia endophytica TaxID=401976 RepID=A0A4R1HEU9_PSEEN|nr:MFS transporter [Pseudonocardia endophytica]TCK20647.1 putative MFS family arabinose efflux permease [Pseudonocardia endophytica]
MPHRTVAVSALGTFLALVSYTAPLATLRQISGDLGTGASGQSWILSSMSLGLTAALLTAGTLADEHGRRRVFVLGSVVLAVASVAGAASPGTLVFVLGRVVQGAGAGAMIACSLALISHAIPSGPRRASASGLWGAALAAGIAIGPLLAGIVPWRPFYLLVAVAAVAVAVAGRMVLDESTSGEPRPVDVPGMVLLAAGLSALLAGLTEARRLPIGPVPIVLLVVGVVLLAGFVVVQRRSSHPMVSLALFRNPGLVAASAGSLATGLGIIAVSSYLPALLQRGQGYGALGAAALLLGWSGTSIVTALLTRRISERVSGPVRLTAGLVVIAAGIVPLAWLTTDSGIALPLLSLIVAGLGTGVVNATLGREAVASVPANRAGMGSGINNTARYLGAAIGVTVVSVLASPTGRETPEQLLAGWDGAVVVCAVLTLACAAAVLACVRRAPAAQPVAG